MQILFVGNFTQRHCSEVHWALTLEDLGHTVIRVQENACTPEQLLEACRTQNIDLFWYVRTWNCLVSMEVLQEIKDLGIPTMSYHLDLYVGLQREDGLDTDAFWRTDYVFSPDGDPKSLEVFARKGINHFHMYPGVYKPECVPGEFVPELAHDVVFVGGGIEYGHSEWPYRRQLVQWLMDTYGDRFGKYGHPQRVMRNEDLNNLYASAKVVVGDSLCPNFTHKNYTTDRITETTGRGGFLIYPRIEGVQDMFEEGKEIVYYDFNDFEQLKGKIDYYLSHESDRKAIQRAGQARALRDHTYHSRIQRALEIVMEGEGIKA